MTTDRSRTLRNTFFSSVGVYTEYALGMLASILIARHLGPDGFGAYSAVIWLVALGIAMVNSGTASAAIKFVAELRGGDREVLVPALLAYLRRAQRLFLLVVIVAGVATLYFGREHFAPELEHWVLIAFLVVTVPLRAGYMFNLGVAKGYENFRATALVALVAAPLNVVLVFVAAWWMEGSEELLLAVFTASSVVFYLMSRQQLATMVPRPAVRVALPAELLARVRRHMLYSAMTVTVGFIAASEVEVMFLNLNGLPDAAGIFKVAYQLSTGAAALVPGVFGALMLPMMAHALSRGREIAGRRFSRSTSYLLLLSAPLMAFGVVFCNDLIAVLYGDRYADAGWVFAVCLVSFSLMTSAQGASSLLISADRQRAVLLVVTGCAVLKVLLDAVLIARFGLNGAAAAYVTVTLVDTVAIVWLAMRTSGAAPEWGRLLRIAAAAALAGLAAWPLHAQLAPVAAVLAGAVVLAAVYLPLSLLLGCWDAGDIEHMQQLHQRFGASRPRAGARLLQWALARTAREART